jgi:hypothetical protein
VEHYVRQAAQRTEQQTLEQIELQALEALDELQVTLGRMAGRKRKGGRLTVGQTICGLRAVHSLWNQVKANEPRADGGRYDGRCGKIQLTKGAATPVPEVTELTMEQMVTAVTEAGLWPFQPLSWWFGS